jgi:hypothetical protein
LKESLSIEYSLGGRKNITNGYGEKLQPKDIIGAYPNNNSFARPQKYHQWGTFCRRSFSMAPLPDKQNLS